MYGSSTYGQSEYGGNNSTTYPKYYAVLEGFVLSEVLAKPSVTKTILENFVISENTHPSRTYTFLEGFTMNDVSVREILNGQTATWIRIPRGRTTWNSLPKN